MKARSSAGSSLGRVTWLISAASSSATASNSVTARTSSRPDGCSQTLLTPRNGGKPRIQSRLVDLPIDSPSDGCCDGEERMPAPLRAGCHSLGGDGRPAEALQRPPVEDATMAKAAGIDLDTTNSVVGAVEGGQLTVIPNPEG